MASVDPSLISDPKEQKWVAEISEILNHQLKIDIETTPSTSIFQIPESMTTQKPEAYEPQQIGLGPIHHFRPIPYKKMEQKKLSAMKRLVQCHKIKDFELTILDEVRKLVPLVRASYDMFLQEDDVFLAWVFAIDGLFLLDLFHTYDVLLDLEKNMDRLLHEFPHLTVDVIIESDIIMFSFFREFLKRGLRRDPKRRILLAQDVIMLENQIPFVVLKEIQKTLNSSSGNFSDSDNNFSPSIFRSYSEIHSPLELCSPSIAPSDAKHLLQYMYDSIVKNKPVGILDRPVAGMGYDDCFPCLDLCSFFSGLTHIQDIPKDEIVQLYKETITFLENFTKNETVFPSAYVLHEKVGFSFHSLHESEGIRYIAIEGKRFSLPMLTLNNDSEVTLRNLVAYEMLATNSDNFPLIEYLRLMCKLIVNVKDVKLLKKSGVIYGDLSDDEVAKLFIGMSSLVNNMKTKENSKLQDKIEEVKKVYESRLIMKARLLLKKLALWLLAILRDIGGFVESSWKIVVFVISIVTVVTLMWQAYCNNFGCDKEQVIKLLQYVSSL